MGSREMSFNDLLHLETPMKRLFAAMLWMILAATSLAGESTLAGMVTGKPGTGAEAPNASASGRLATPAPAAITATVVAKSSSYWLTPE